MRYSIFLPDIKGGYKVGDENDLIAVLCARQKLNQKFQADCLIYDNELRTDDVQAMMINKFEEDHFLKW